MKKKPALVGGFVLIALVLLVVSAILFLGKGIFQDKLKYVVYFDGSVNGLHIGSPVTFRGVKIGQVSNMQVTINQSDGSIKIPVEIKLHPGSFVGTEEKMIIREARNYVAKLVTKRNLRAQLQTISLITGQLCVNLDFYPDKPARYIGPGIENGELPSIPSDFEILSNTLKSIPLEKIIERLMRSLEGIEKIVSSKELYNAVENLEALTKDFGTLICNTDKQIHPLLQEAATAAKSFTTLADSANQKLDPLAASLEATLKEMRTAIAELNRNTNQLGQRVGNASDAARDAFTGISKAMAPKDGAVAKITNDVNLLVKETQATMGKISLLVEKLGGMTTEDSPFRHQILQTLKEITEAASEIQRTADYLHRNPEALLRGRKKGE